MKSVLTVAAFLFISTVYSQGRPVEQKVATIKKGIVIKSDTIKMTRLYKFKNSRIKRALNFTIGRNTLIA